MQQWEQTPQTHLPVTLSSSSTLSRSLSAGVARVLRAQIWCALIKGFHESVGNIEQDFVRDEVRDQAISLGNG